MQTMTILILQMYTLQSDRILLCTVDTFNTVYDRYPPIFNFLQ